MTLDARPPSRMTPWIRDVSGRNRRNASMDTKSWMTAARALRPSAGLPAACAAMPWNSKVIGIEARAWRIGMVLSPGWNISAASTSSKTPASSSMTLPPAPSSPGVPMTRSVPGGSGSACIRAVAAPIPPYGGDEVVHRHAPRAQVSLAATALADPVNHKRTRPWPPSTSRTATTPAAQHNPAPGHSQPDTGKHERSAAVAVCAAAVRSAPSSGPRVLVPRARHKRR